MNDQICPTGQPKYFALFNQQDSLNGLHGPETALANEAGVPFVLPPSDQSGIDPFAEWLSLMEVVEMLCPAWPVRNKPLVGTVWRL